PGWRGMRSESPESASLTDADGGAGCNSSCICTGGFVPRAAPSPDCGDPPIVLGTVRPFFSLSLLTLLQCGDGRVDASLGEACEPSTSSGGLGDDGCSSSCRCLPGFLERFRCRYFSCSNRLTALAVVVRRQLNAATSVWSA